jgi:hypothetical protein
MEYNLGRRQRGKGWNKQGIVDELAGRFDRVVGMDEPLEV